MGAGSGSSILSEANVFEPTGGTAESLKTRLVSASGGSEFHDASSWLGTEPLLGLDTLAGGSRSLGWAPPYGYQTGSSAAAVTRYVDANAGAGKLAIEAP